MNKKLFVAAMASLALAACNNEDIQTVENTAVKSPIVFGVSMDGNSESRAAWGGSGYTLQWVAEHADKMSFFHGITSTNGSITGAQNAVYEATSKDGEGVNFTTNSMINPGYGVMVYPTDTTFNYNGNKLYLSVPATQTPASNLLIPFMSNVINIASYDATKGDGAGYAKKYDIALKQVGTLFTLKTEWEGGNAKKIQDLVDAGEVAALSVNKVSLKSSVAFNQEVEVVITDTVPAPEKTVNGRDNWAHVTKAIPSNRYSTTTLSSTAINGLDKTEFVLMPTDTTDTALANIIESENNAVIVETNYGTVTLYNKGNVWYKYNADPTLIEKVTISEGLKELLKLTHYVKPAGTANPTYFPNEWVGAHATRHLDANLNDLDMSTVHIKNEAQLLDMITVHEAIQEGEDVVFTIDGDANQVFEMSTSTVAKLNELPHISVKACTTADEKCATILLTDATEVPSFKFMVDNAVNVQLANEATAWTWTTGSKNMYKVTNLINLGTLNVSNNATVGLYNYASNTDASLSGNLINEGTMNILSGIAHQVESMTNIGVINVAAEAQYRVDNKLVNEAISLEKYGIINNSGVFGCVDNGVVNNYGYIKQVTENSLTYVTTNQTDNAAFNANFSGKNKFGIIELNSKDDDNYSVSNEQNEGFIMITTTAATVTAEEIGNQANYVKVAGECTSIDNNFDGQGRVKFIEIASSKRVIWTTTDSYIRGLIVKAGQELQIKKNNTVRLSQGAYLKGTIFNGGEFVSPSYVTYLGGATTDASNVVKW